MNAYPSWYSFGWTVILKAVRVLGVDKWFVLVLDVILSLEACFFAWQPLGQHYTSEPMPRGRTHTVILAGAKDYGPHLSLAVGTVKRDFYQIVHRCRHAIIESEIDRDSRDSIH